jgi:hypothetical protein
MVLGDHLRHVRSDSCVRPTGERAQLDEVEAATTRYETQRSALRQIGNELHDHALTVTESIAPDLRCPWCSDLHANLTEAIWFYRHVIEQGDAR